MEGLAQRKIDSDLNEIDQTTALEDDIQLNKCDKSVDFVPLASLHPNVTHEYH